MDNVQQDKLKIITFRSNIIKKSKEIKTPIDAEIVLPFDVAKEFLSILDKRISLADSKQKQLLAESKKKGK